MATNKTRINITTEPEVEVALKASAKRENVPVATKAAELLALALSLEEDMMLGLVADDRRTMKGTYVSHSKAWDRL
ncbi:MAG: hypothetical protein V1489_00025 [Candidatus Liptonbacteria bacterium]